MAIKDILSADLPTVGEWIGQGWRWWTGELAAMLPASLRARGGRGGRFALRRAGGHGFEMVRDGRIEALVPGTAARPRRIALGLAEAGALVRRVEVPQLGASDLRQMLGHDLDRLTPFSAEAVYFDSRVVERRGTTMEVDLAVIPRERLAEELAVARAAALDPTRIALLAGDGTARFDFLRAMRLAEGGKPPADPAVAWWIAVAALFVLVIGVTIARDMIELSRLRAAVEAEAPLATGAQAFSQRVAREQARRAALAARRARHEPLGLIAGLSRVLPEGAWVQRLTWNGVTLRLVGYKPEAIDVIAALRSSPLLANVREATSDTPATLATGQPFDVEADRRGAARR